MIALLKVVGRIVVYSLAFVVPIVGLAGYGYYSTLMLTMPKPAALEIAETGDDALNTKPFDPARPTVAIVLGSSRTEDTDFLIPYELFSAAGAYNVYGVAPERQVYSTAGGLEVMPDYSYAELAAMLGHAPEVVVIPAIPNPGSPANAPILAWIKQQAADGAYIFSICVGAETFAATGLLDGRTATTHWGDIERIEQAYPEVEWVRGVRYVDGGDHMTSAGITSGIDAVLHYIAQHNGDQLAQRITQDIHYPSYAYVNNPQVEQQSASTGQYLVGLINILFHPVHPVVGVLLYDGVGELELAAAYDTYAATYTTKLVGVSPTRRLITTQHGLQVVPRSGFADVQALERLIVPGSRAHQLAAAELNAWSASSSAAPVFYLHANTPAEFAFDAPLRDLAQRENIPTAVLNAKRLEYRAGTLQTEGARWPVWLTIRPLLAGLGGLALALVLGRRWSRRARTSKAGPQTTHRHKPVAGSTIHSR
ncbi:MAG: DJ-1/PfpI family protein [Anaerolineales bacterium]|nr:DJ-1/PfpI family protein [Anaerolineales bacterium]